MIRRVYSAVWHAGEKKFVMQAEPNLPDGAECAILLADDLNVMAENAEAGVPAHRVGAYQMPEEISGEMPDVIEIGLDGETYTFYLERTIYIPNAKNEMDMRYVDMDEMIKSEEI